MDKDGGGSVEIDELEEFWNEVKVKHDEDYDDYVAPGEGVVVVVAGGGTGAEDGEQPLDDLLSVDLSRDGGSEADA